MKKTSLIEAIACVLHQMELHVLDALKDFGDVALQKRIQELSKPYKELNETRKSFFRYWAIRIINVLTVLKLVRQAKEEIIPYVEEDQKRGEEGS